MTNFNVNLSDTVTITDSLSRQAAYHRALSDTVTITDSISAAWRSFNLPKLLLRVFAGKTLQQTLIVDE